MENPRKPRTESPRGRRRPQRQENPVADRPVEETARAAEQNIQRGTGDLLGLMADGFDASNPTLQSAVPERESGPQRVRPEAGAPEHSASAADLAADDDLMLPAEDSESEGHRRGIVSIDGEDVEEIELPRKDRAA